MPMSGGVHVDVEAVCAEMDRLFAEQLGELESLSPEDLLEARYQKFRAMGQFTEERARA